MRNGLGIAGLIFSCLFLVELIASVWAFGWRYVISTVLSFCLDVGYIGRYSNTPRWCLNSQEQTSCLLMDLKTHLLTSLGSPAQRTQSPDF